MEDDYAARLMAASELMYAALHLALEQAADGLHPSDCDVPDCWVEAAERALDAAASAEVSDG